MAAAGCLSKHVTAKSATTKASRARRLQCTGSCMRPRRTARTPRQKPPRSARTPHVLNPGNPLFRRIRRTFSWATSGNSAPLSCWQIIEESMAGIPHHPAASAAAVWLVAKTSSGEQSRSKRMVSAPRRSEQQSTCAASQPRSLHSSAIPAAGSRQTSTCFLESNSRMCGYPKP